MGWRGDCCDSILIRLRRCNWVLHGGVPMTPLCLTPRFPGTHAKEQKRALCVLVPGEAFPPSSFPSSAVHRTIRKLRRSEKSVLSPLRSRGVKFWINCSSSGSVKGAFHVTASSLSSTVVTRNLYFFLFSGVYFTLTVPLDVSLSAAAPKREPQNRCQPPTFHRRSSIT